MTREEFIRNVIAVRETVRLFLTNMPPDATAAEILRMIDVEATDADAEHAYSRFCQGDISATGSMH